MTHTSLTLYRPAPSSSLSTTSRSDTLIPSRLFTAQTGTAIATELLYRILVEILNRLFSKFQHFASERLDQLSEYLETRARERREATMASAAAAANAKVGGDGGEKGGLGIVDEVGKLVKERGFECPMTGKEGRGPREWMEKRRMGGKTGLPAPPRWVRGVMDGIEEGRLESRDFWVQTHGD
ncbi:hypothetical protein BCR34DRAFT_582089 [Clohesyomyces aquaticus]|uniref:Uncharacterized protein n=1 Tax=Clohesyomyces aquaticus TaxID=1231657 RepID=A0A1Y2AC75_9PLEO|nr:hypothetical protein BCR34DRAFT_582089 [Clohesyomyces aquaticus]